MSRDAALLVEEIQRVQGEARDYLKKAIPTRHAMPTSLLRKRAGLLQTDQGGRRTFRIHPS